MLENRSAEMLATETTTVDLATLLHAALAHSSLLIGTRPIRLIADIDAGLPRVAGSKVMMVDLGVRYLLHCSIYTTQRGSITLSAKRERQMILIAVMDTSTQQLSSQPEETLFPLTTPGANLPQLKRILEAFGGNFWLESEADAGTAYFMRIPL